MPDNLEQPVAPGAENPAETDKPDYQAKFNGLNAAFNKARATWSEKEAKLSTQFAETMGQLKEYEGRVSDLQKRIADHETSANEWKTKAETHAGEIATLKRGMAQNEVLMAEFPDLVKEARFLAIGDREGDALKEFLTNYRAAQQGRLQQAVVDKLQGSTPAAPPSKDSGTPSKEVLWAQMSDLLNKPMLTAQDQAQYDALSAQYAKLK